MLNRKYIYIDGYWLDTKEEFSNYRCVLGDSGIDEENDDDVFYYFETEKDLNFFKVSEGRLDTEFVITEIREGKQSIEILYTKLL